MTDLLKKYRVILPKIEGVARTFTGEGAIK